MMKQKQCMVHTLILTALIINPNSAISSSDNERNNASSTCHEFASTIFEFFGSTQTQSNCDRSDNSSSYQLLDQKYKVEIKTDESFRNSVVIMQTQAPSSETRVNLITNGSQGTRATRSHSQTKFGTLPGYGTKKAGP
jgi:hypothetical protein